jgi:hypothetical protein
MRIRVLRVTGMPHGALLWIDDQPRRFTVYIDESLITELGVQVLEGALNYIVQFWRRLPAVEVQRPHLRPVVG